MLRPIVYAVLFVLATVCAVLVEPDTVLFAIAVGLITSVVVMVIEFCISNASVLTWVFYVIRTWRIRVRISASYLYRIKVDNHYLLVHGMRFDQFQPVGGVYKFHTSWSSLRESLDVRDDNLLVPDDVSESDIRVRVPGKNLLKFRRWYEESANRETDGWREFYEELIVPGHLPASVFPYIRYDRLKRIYKPMRFSEWAGSQEILIADIFELIPSVEQLRELRKLKDRDVPELLWATEDQINRRGAVAGQSTQNVKIAQTAAWTL